MNSKKINLVVLNYNGKHLLEKYLSSILFAAKKTKYPCRVTVVDNKSSDDSVDFVKSKFPEISVYVAKENRVLCSLNDYFKEIDDDIVVILNNDLRLDAEFVDPLMPYFDKKEILFVAPKELDLAGNYRGNLNRVVLKFGLLSAAPELKGIDFAQYDISVGGGAFDRKKLLELDGYDELYLPGIFEDFDVCYRGWKHGWKGVYEPKSFYYHEGSVSFNAKYSSNAKMRISCRNAFLFFWKNVCSRKMILLHIIFIPFLLTMALLRLRFAFILGFFDALGRFKAVLRSRAVAKKQFKISDEDVFKFFSHLPALA
ncbi:MAG: glycosyltransferase [Candidatus Omnitrophica bacterium]|nr:glycosyltransferase [Candidatus Omnitrophota bacterium]